MNETESKKLEKELIAEERNLFQVERIAFFSDAVMAIALTLLVIEFHLPVPGHGEHSVSVAEFILQFVALVATFVVIAALWVCHHRTFGKVKNYTSRFITLNMIFLFTIVLLPAMMNYLFNPHAPEGYKNLAFSVSYFLCWSSCWLLVRYAFNPRNNMLVYYEQEANARALRYLGAISLFCIVPIIATLINPRLMGPGYAVFAFLSLVNRKKKDKSVAKQAQQA